MAAAIRESTSYLTQIPHFVEGMLFCGGKTYTITPILQRDRDEVGQFLTTESSPYFRDGKPYDIVGAAARVARLIDRHIKGEPWSAYLLRPESGELAGMWVVGYDDKPGDLNVALFVKSQFQRQGLARTTWDWTVKHFIPEMIRRDVKVNDKPLRDAFIRATTHPQHLAPVLESAGFKKVEDQVDDDYAAGGVNDGRRILYEIAVKDFL